MKGRMVPNENKAKGSPVVRWVGVALAALVILGATISLFWNTDAKAQAKAVEANARAQAKAVEAKSLADQNQAGLVRHAERLATLEKSRVKMVEHLGAIRGNIKVLLERTKGQ